MAGLMFVVCVPTGTHERNLIESSRKSLSSTSEDLTQQTNTDSTNSLKRSSVTDEKFPEIFRRQESVQQELKLQKQTSLSSVESKSKFEKQSSLSSLESKNDFNIPSVVITVDGKDEKSEVKPRHQEEPSKFAAKKGTADSSKVPHHEGELPMEKVLEKVLKKLRIENAVWCPGQNGQYYQVFFSVDSSDRCEEILRHLSDCEIGTKLNSAVSVVPCTLYYHGKDQPQLPDDSHTVEAENERKFSMKVSAWEKFVQSVRARLTVAQVVEGVKANANLTFDFVILLLTSAFAAAVGLAEDSTVILVASMLISPLMGPIMAGTFGTVIGDKHLQKIGVLNELFGLLGCLVVGFAFGLVAGLANEHWGNASWPTDEMISRGLVRALWVGLLVAIASGAALAIAILGDNTASIVGVAISASLLPPAVNAGLLWALSFIEFVWKGRIELDTEDMDPLVRTYTPVYSESPAIELAILGAVSLCLTLVNIICIFVTGIIILKIKEVAPRTSKDQEQFWKHDIKIARDYNRTFTGQDADDLKFRLAEELACSEIQQNLQGLSPNLLNRFPNLAHRRSFLKPQELFKTGLVGYPIQQTWSPSTTTILPESRPTMQDLENLYNTLAVNGTQAQQTRIRRHSGGIPWSTGMDQNLIQRSRGPSLTSSMAASCNTIPCLTPITESQFPWSAKPNSKTASEPQNQTPNNVPGQIKGTTKW